MTHSPNGWSPAGENVQAQEEQDQCAENANCSPSVTSHDPLVEALEILLPPILCGESWDLPDTETVPIITTFGAIKRARQALSAHRGEPT